MTLKKSGSENDLTTILVQLAEFAVAGKSREAILFLRKTYSFLIQERPEIIDRLQTLLTHPPLATRRATTPPTAVPVDSDSRFELLRRNDQPQVEAFVRWPSDVMDELDTIIAEREMLDELRAVGMTPTRSVLMTGPPGVGKTVAATWIAQQLGRPLLTLDLASVMSSYLGKTGNNVRSVLDYARSGPYVLLLDEFDAIAKRRDDASDVGELKRLVTVLLQAIDEWPEDGMLIAATNHPELLDPAVWRRFERVIEFPNPDAAQVRYFIEQELQRLKINFNSGEIIHLSRLLKGTSYAGIARILRTSHRNALVRKLDTLETIYSSITRRQDCSQEERIEIARELNAAGWSQRRTSTATGLARNTITKYLSTGKPQENHG